MYMTISTLPPEIRNLPVSERVALVERIWDSIAEDETEFQLTDAQRSELDRRLARREASGGSSTWSDVKQRILGKS
jgi:putative addiction module component (TIGR02574 family)